MAAVTINQTPPILAPARHVIGDLSTRFYNISGASGSTLVVPFSQILWLDTQPFTTAGTASLITGISLSGQTVTFTSSAPMVNEIIQVIGREG